MTAWSAKVVASSICLSLNGFISIAGERERANGRPLAQEWDAKEGSIAERLLIASRAVFGIGQNVWNMNCLAFQRDTPGRAAAVRLYRMAQRVLHRLVCKTVIGAYPIRVALPHHDGALVGSTKSRRGLRQRIEHRL